MHLLASLAAGIRGAEDGTVNLLLRGTSTAATYYADFEATQQLPGTAVPLDSNGRLIAYVSALVDVVVHDSLGNDVCEFVAGSEDASVEVISPSFTGVDYTSGASGTQKPTNLEVVLDRWLASAGAADWKVLLNGSPTNLSAAFSATFFNVRTYGAVGNGVADDRSAIVAAQAAAVAAGGGVVFFPGGVYRVTASIPLAGGVTWLGCGGQSTKIAGDAAVTILTIPGNGAGQLTSVSGLWFGSINAAANVLITYSAVSTGSYHFTDCVFGNDALSSSSIYAGAGGLATMKAVFTRCYLKLTAGTSQLLINDTARLIVRDCDLINANAVGVTMVDCSDNGVFEGNRFDWSAAAVGPGIKYLNVGPTSTGSVVIIGNRFARNGAIACTAIYNNLAAPVFDVLEYGNTFGDPVVSSTGCTPYGYLTDGYAAYQLQHTVGHLTRLGRTEMVAAAAAANQAVDPKGYGTSVIKRTGGGNLTVDANKGSMGDRWTLHINNTSGGAITVTAGTNVIFDPAVAPLPITNNGFAEVTLAWLPTAGGVGNWYQVGKAVLS